MNVSLEVVGEHQDEIRERAEHLAVQFAGEQPYVIKYGPGYAKEFDTRQGVRHSFARPGDMKLMFVVPVVIEVGDDPTTEETTD